MLTNQQIVNQLEQMASALEIQQANTFRIRAYQTAAQNISRLKQPLHNLWERGELDKVSGLGEKLRTYLDELFRTGKVKHFEDTFSQLPSGMTALLPLEGIGAKTAHLIASNFQLPVEDEAARQKVLQLAQNKKLQDLPNFGEKSEQDLISAIEIFQSQDTSRILIAKAWPLAQEVIHFLKQSPSVQKAEVLGSLRRRKETVGDIDIAVATSQPEKVMNHVKQFSEIKKVLASGSKMTSFVHNQGLQVDIKTQSPERWGSMLQHFTGSKQHNVELRQRALKLGFSMSEYGLKRSQDNKTITFTNESDLYHHLDLDYIPPTLRENNGEIVAAAQGKLPQLVQLKQIKGDLHLHCNLDFPTSHDRGASSPEELFKRAVEKGYQYLGITDHNPPQKGLSAEEKLKLVKSRTELLRKRHQQWSKATNSNLTLWIGMEVDIRPNGTLALENESLEELDYVIASIHSSHKMNREDMTRRITKALMNPYVRILGHPTGRIINSRSEINANWDKIFALAAKRHIILEINASPERLDLPDQLARQALEHDVTLVINTDAHQLSHLENMRYGVWTAQRGWLSANNILNTMPTKKVAKKLILHP